METYVKRFDELTTTELYEILKLRGDIFVIEQQNTTEEIDGDDYTAIHVFMKEADQKQLEAYARILPPTAERQNVKIGRVASRQRRGGLGTKIMEAAIQAVRDNFDADYIYLEAQTYIKDFYERLGFVVIGEEFMAAEILHVPMTLDL